MAARIFYVDNNLTVKQFWPVFKLCHGLSLHTNTPAFPGCLCYEDLNIPYCITTFPVAKTWLPNASASITI
jgi:hypothetical protein